MINHNKKQTGFTLLMTLIVVSVVVSVGLTILDLSIKQLKLSTGSKDSEIAFHAANAGLECAQYNREINAATIEGGGDTSFSCFGSNILSTAANINFSDNSVAGNGVYRYEHSFTWGETGSERCTEITTVALSTNGITDDSITVDVGDMMAAVPGYPISAGDKVCDPGAQCTIVSVRGYSRSCSEKNIHGAIQREVLLEF